MSAPQKNYAEKMELWKSLDLFLIIKCALLKIWYRKLRLVLEMFWVKSYTQLA